MMLTTTRLPRCFLGQQLNTNNTTTSGLSPVMRASKEVLGDKTITHTSVLTLPPFTPHDDYTRYKNHWCTPIFESYKNKHVLLHYQTLSVHAQTNLTMRMTESVKGIEGGGYVP